MLQQGLYYDARELAEKRLLHYQRLSLQANKTSPCQGAHDMAILHNAALTLRRSKSKPEQRRLLAEVLAEVAGPN